MRAPGQLSSTNAPQFSLSGDQSAVADHADQRWVTRLISERAVAIQAEMRAAAEAEDGQKHNLHLRNARVLAREITNVIDGHVRPPGPFRRVRPVVTSHEPRIGGRIDTPRAAVSRLCATCEHWYPEGPRRLADGGNCRKPLLAPRVNAGRGDWPICLRCDTCQDWQRDPSL